MLEQLPILIAMFVLMLFSAFFSTSEASFFSLSRNDILKLREGGRFARLAASLSEEPERLLSTILLGNLSVNVLYFTLSSVVTIRLSYAGNGTTAGVFGVASLLALIVFSEMLPKDIGVMMPQRIAKLCALPLYFLTKILRRTFPLFKGINLLSRRLIAPDFEIEPDLRGADLERAVELSKEDATLLKREERVLLNVLNLSEMRTEELMRPRKMLRFFKPPVEFPQIVADGHSLPECEYVLITEPDSDELASAVSLKGIRGTDSVGLRWDEHSNPVAYVPWSASVAEAMDTMQAENAELAAVLNEYGETIGILIYEDVLETLFGMTPSRSRRLLKRSSVRKIEANTWHVTGITRISRLERMFRVRLPEHENTSIAGLLHEILRKIPEAGDTCQWGPFRFTVLERPEKRTIIVELKLIRGNETESACD